MFNDLTRVIEQYGKEMGVNREIVVEAIETAMVTAAKKKLSPHIDLEAYFNDDTGEVDLFQFKLVVEDDDLADPDTEIELADAKKEDPDVELGDSLGIKIDTAEFGRIVAQTARYVISQKLKEAEREIIYSEFLKRRGEIITGTVRRIERGNIIIDLGKTEAYIPEREQIPGEQYRTGDRIQAYLLDVLQTPRGPRIILSRSSTLYLMKLFELEVPEIADGIIQIKSVSREPGTRAKMAVISKDVDVDPYGACIGVRGSRIQNIVNELRGEKIDIILYDENAAIYAKNAITPAAVSKVIVYENDSRMEIIVPDDQLSLSIGRRGVNVRLAAKLINWRLDIIGETDLNKRYNNAKSTFMQIPQIDETRAIALFHNGFATINNLRNSSVEDLLKVPGFTDASENEKILNYAKNVEDLVNDEKEISDVSMKHSYQSADEMLKEELKLLVKKETKNSDDMSEKLLSIKGIGPSFVKKLTEAGVNAVSDIITVSSEDFIAKLKETIKDEEKLLRVYEELKIKEKELAVKKDDTFKNLEKELESKSIDFSDKIITRLIAVELTTLSALSVLSKDEFLNKVKASSNELFIQFFEDLKNKK